MRQVDGLVVVDKPPGCTSHDVVARCRRIFGQTKVGHAGTLDPDATGVLLVGLGRATRLLQFLSGLAKRYSGEVVLGVATSTLDASGEVTGTWDMRGVTVEAARLAAAQLTGEIAQVPPMVSALKVGGRRLYELARAGVEVERPARAVFVKRFEVNAAEGALIGDETGPVLAVDIECSSGTYVRSLAADLGMALGGGAHLRRLRRLAVGDFLVEQAVTLDELGVEDVLAPVNALARMGQIVAGVDLAVAVSHGKVMPRDGLHGATGPGPWAVLSEAGELLAVYQALGHNQVKPAVVLAPAP